MTENVRRYLIYVVVSVCLALIIVFSYLNRYFTSDDALIYYRYVANVLSGNGLVYNTGERFNALSSPLYTYISICAAYIVGDVPTSQTILGGVFLFLASVSFLLFRDEDLPFPAKIVVPLLIVTNRFFYATFGLETTLFLFLCVAAFVMYRRERYSVAAILGALLLLTRGEGIFLIIVLMITHFIRRRPVPSLNVFVIPIFLLLVHYTFNYLYFGAVFPETLMAKVYQGQSNLWESRVFGKHLIFLSVGYHYDVFFGRDPALLAMFSIFALLGIVAHRKNSFIKTVFSFLVIYSAFYILLNIPNYHWYYGVYYLFGCVFAALGLYTVGQMFQKIPVLQSARGGGLVLAVLCLVLLVRQTSFTRGALASAGGYMNYKEIGTWVRDNTEEDAKIACVEIGHVGWYSGRYIIDILGLVTPHNAKLVGERKLDEWLKYYHPDYLLVHDPLWPHESSVQSLEDKRLFLPMENFDFPGFRLLKKNQQS